MFGGRQLDTLWVARADTNTEVPPQYIVGKYKKFSPSADERAVSGAMSVGEPWVLMSAESGGLAMSIDEPCVIRECW